MTWLLFPLAIWAAVFFHRRRHRVHLRHVVTRSRYHEAYLEFVTEALEDPEIRKLLIDRRVMSERGVEIARNTAGQALEPWVRAIAARITGDRVVRRRLSALLSARRGENKHRMMNMLTEMTEVVR